jgi:hypothetical protein
MTNIRDSRNRTVKMADFSQLHINQLVELRLPSQQTSLIMNMIAGKWVYQTSLRAGRTRSVGKYGKISLRR